MSKAERINYLEKSLFFLSMKDRWSAEDYKRDREWSNELRALAMEG